MCGNFSSHALHEDKLTIVSITGKISFQNEIGSFWDEMVMRILMLIHSQENNPDWKTHKAIMKTTSSAFLKGEILKLKQIGF